MKKAKKRPRIGQMYDDGLRRVKIVQLIAPRRARIQNQSTGRVSEMSWDAIAIQFSEAS